jgi:NADH-quinone oxidoreductase subunit L
MLSIIILFPLLGFIFSILFGRKMPKMLVGTVASLAILASFVGAIMVFNQVGITPSGISQKLFTFLSIEGFDVSFSLFADRITAVMLLVITGIGFLIHMYSIGYMKHDDGFYKFFAYLNLFVFNMLILVLGSNLLVLFFGWEGVGLCSYLLIGFWYQNESFGKAARKAFIMNRIGDLGLLLAIFLCAINVGSLEFSVITEAAIAGKLNVELITGICFLLFIGAMGKSAQLPLYTWLPDAMAGPTPVSALIHAATMVTAGVYLLVRTQGLFMLSNGVNEFVMVVGLVTSLVAALIGLKQNDIKKVLAYSTVSQLGFMFIALGVGAHTAAMFHLVTHAFFKALLFLGSGSIIHAMGDEQDMRRMGGLKKYMPITYITFLIGTLAISGFPFLSGFFSKDEILASAFLSNKLVWGLAIVSATLTGFYMFRMFFVVFFGQFRGTQDQKDHLHESPWLMTLPLVILAALSVVGGYLNLPAYLGSISGKLHHWLKPNLPIEHNPVLISHGTEIMLISVAVGVFTLAFVTQYIKYLKKQVVPEEDADMSAAGLVLANKLYIDEAYDKMFVEPTEKLGGITEWIDINIIGLIPKALAGVNRLFARFMAKVQNGNIEYYLVYMSIAVFLIIILSAISVKIWN